MIFAEKRWGMSEKAKLPMGIEDFERIDLRVCQVIACEKVNGQLVFVDPQIGLIGPSALGNANSAGYSWFRMDNLDIKPNLLTDIAKPSGKKP